MTDLILKLLGARVEAAGDLASARLAFQGGLGAGWVIVLALALAALGVWTYRQWPPSTTPARRYLLTGLRVAFLVLLTFLLLRPVLSFTVEGSVRRTLLLLVDGSASMQIKDPRVNPDDLKRAALAKGLMDPTKGLTQQPAPARAREVQNLNRLDVLKGALKNEKLDLLPRLDYEFDLVPFTFGTDLNALPRGKTELTEGEGEAKKTRRKAKIAQFDWVDKLEANAITTPIGDSLRKAVELKRGQPLAGVVLLTDGGNNSGLSPRELAAQLKQDGVPLYIYGLGITSPRDIIMANLFAPEVSFVKDEVMANVRVRSQGLAGEKAKVILKLGDTKVDEREITFGPDGEQVVALRFTPDKTGDFELEASIEARPDETVKDNNARVQHLRVIDSKIRVLLVEQSPRWDFRYLQAMFMRDRRVELKCVLFEGAPSIARDDNSPYLDRFPANKDELFKYDLIVLGDVDPRQLTPEQQRNVNEFVARFGGSLLMVAGKRFSPGAWRNTPIEQLLPVEFDAVNTATATGDGSAEKPVKLALTTQGRTSTMLRLADKEEESLALWKTLPPIYWVAKVSR